MEKQLIEIERELYLAYIAKLGGGHSVVRQFKAFLMNGQRASEGRRMITGAQNKAKEMAMFSAQTAPIQVKPSAPLVPGLEPNKQTAQLPNKSTEQPQSGAKDVPVVAGRISSIVADIVNGVSNTQMAAKYDKKELTECAVINGVTVLPDWSEKQIVAAIKKDVQTA